MALPLSYFIEDLEIGDGFEKRDRLLNLLFLDRQLIKITKTGARRAIAWMNQQLEALGLIWYETQKY